MTKTPQTGQLNHRCLFLAVQEAGFGISKMKLAPGEGLSPGSQMAFFSLSPLVVEGAQGLL